MAGRPMLLDKTPLPALIYGTARRPDQTAPDTSKALSLGHCAFDLASSRLHHNEAEDGLALAHAARESVFLQSKYAPPEAQAEPWPYNLHDDIRTQVFKSVLRSARDLKVDAMDAYMLHTQLRCSQEMLEAWRALEEIVARGGVRFLGICNVSAARLRELYAHAVVKPTIVQNWLRQKTKFDREVVQFCKTHGIVYQAFGVFDEDNRHLVECDLVQQHARTRSIDAYQSLLELLLAVAKSQRLQLCVLDGSRNIEHMKQNLKGSKQKIDVDDVTLESFACLLNWN
ncbi:oxidoreductase [Paramyrothecium foliicola]|nr:oxidoreductase [Paramyrothecium foliicola]